MGQSLPPEERDRLRASLIRAATSECFCILKIEEKGENHVPGGSQIERKK